MNVLNKLLDRLAEQSEAIRAVGQPHQGIKWAEAVLHLRDANRALNGALEAMRIAAAEKEADDE